MMTFVGLWIKPRTTSCICKNTARGRSAPKVRKANKVHRDPKAPKVKKGTRGIRVHKAPKVSKDFVAQRGTMDPLDRPGLWVRKAKWGHKAHKGIRGRKAHKGHKATVV